jgi:hypothetical protein
MCTMGWRREFSAPILSWTYYTNLSDVRVADKLSLFNNCTLCCSYCVVVPVCELEAKGMVFLAFLEWLLFHSGCCWSG